MSRLARSTSLVCLWVLLAAHLARAGGPAITATPASVARDDPGTVRLEVLGLTQPEAWLRLIVDVDGDGIVDRRDVELVMRAAVRL